MLVSVLGDIRVGKTLFTSILAKYSYGKVYANYHLDIPQYYKLEPTDLFKLPNNCEVFIDEAYTWLEARTSGADLNKCSSYILFQSGKRTINIYLTAQLFSTVDIRFRHMSNIIVEVYKYEDEELFEYNFYERVRGELIFRNTWYLPFNEAEKYYDIYDTLEIVEPHTMKNLETKLIMSDGKKLFKKAKEIAKLLKPELDKSDKKNKYTHDAIKFELLKEDISLNYEKFVYLVLHHKNKDKMLAIV